MSGKGKRGMRLRWGTERKSTVLRYYFLTYFTVLLIPMLICCIYYIRVLSIINEDDIRSRKEELEHSAVLIDTLAERVADLGDTLAANTEVHSFQRLNAAFQYPNTYRILELQDALPELYPVDQSIFNYFIFFDRSETVINKNSAYTYPQFYELYLHEQWYADYEQWYEYRKQNLNAYGFGSMEVYESVKEGRSRNLLAYTQPLIDPDKAGNGGCVMIFLEEEVLETMMPTMTDGGLQLIENGSGEILYYQKAEDAEWEAEIPEGEGKTEPLSPGECVLTEMKWAGRQCLMISYQSQETDLRYITMFPSGLITERMTSSVMMLGLFIFLGLAVGIGLSYHMSKKSATPINEILTRAAWTLERSGTHWPVFNRLKDTFDYLMEPNSDLTDALEKQKPYIRNAFANRLMFASFIEEEELAKTASQIGWPYKNRVLGVLIFRFHLSFQAVQTDGETGQKLLEVCTVSLLEAVEKVLPDSLYTDLGEGQVAVLLNFPEKYAPNYRAEAERLVARIKESMPSGVSEKVFVYGGNAVHSPEQVHESFHDAAYVFHNESEQIENEVIWFQDSQNDIPVFPSQEIGVKLTHYVTAGDEKGLHDALEEIVRTYLLENNLPVYLQHMLLNEMQTILFRILGYVKLTEEEYRQYYEELEENHNVPLITQITKTLNLYQRLCSYLNAQKRPQDSGKLADAIASYIDTNFGDYNLCLAGVADRFGISEQYLSSLFKQNQGINFSTYVEDVRIDKAKDYLKTTGLSVGEIAGLVGYGSTNSFCRAFKRVTGINASEYRKT